MPDPQSPARDALDAQLQGRLAAQSDALTSLTARYTNPDERLDARRRSILDTAARALSVGRLSLWQFEPGRSSITCVGRVRVRVSARADVYSALGVERGYFFAAFLREITAGSASWSNA